MNKKFSHFLWDLFCTLSIIGIWPRFIEPKLLDVKRLKFNLNINKPLKAAFFSDLHFNEKTPKSLLEKIILETSNFKPDMIFFLGDFLCDSVLNKKEELKIFLNTFSAPLGCYAILGNHDYLKPVSINMEGYYDIAQKNTPFSKGFRRLFNHIELKKETTSRAKNIPLSTELLDLLKATPFQLLNNQTVQIKGLLNLVGLGEYMLGQADLNKALKNLDPSLPNLVLVHNPDMIKKIPLPSIVLSGHTHGGQINLPWLWKRLTVMEEIKFKAGEVEWEGKKAYITRGVGSVIPFRFNASPELCLMEISP